jgi:beta-lactamase class A
MQYGERERPVKTSCTHWKLRASLLTASKPQSPYQVAHAPCTASFRLPLLGLIFLLFSCAGFSQNRSTAGLRSQIEKIAEAAQGKVGVTATVLETGESVALRGEQQFPMQSVYKFPIGMATLHLVDQGKLKLQQKVHVDKDEYVRQGQYSPLRDKYPQGVTVSLEELLRLAVSESDGSASDVLLRLAGGAEAVTQYLQKLGVNGIKVVDTEKEIGRDVSVQYRNWATPKTAVALLQKLHDGKGLSAASRALLLQLMTETPTGMRRLKGLLPAGAVVAHKTGTSGTTNGLTHATNDIGIITLPNGRHLAVAVFVSDARANEVARERVIAQIARAAWEYWSQRTKTESGNQ